MSDMPVHRSADYVRPPERTQKLVVEATTVYVIEMCVEADVTPEEALKQAQQDSCLYEYFHGNSVDGYWDVRLPTDIDQISYGHVLQQFDGPRPIEDVSLPERREYFPAGRSAWPECLCPRTPCPAHNDGSQHVD